MVNIRLITSIYEKTLQNCITKKNLKYQFGELRLLTFVLSM